MSPVPISVCEIPQSCNSVQLHRHRTELVLLTCVQSRCVGFNVLQYFSKLSHSCIWLKKGVTKEQQNKTREHT